MPKAFPLDYGIATRRQRRALGWPVWTFIFLSIVMGGLVVLRVLPVLLPRELGDLIDGPNRVFLSLLITGLVVPWLISCMVLAGVIYARIKR